MIYAVCATQLITVLCGLIAARWCIAYLETRDKADARTYEITREALQELTEKVTETLAYALDEAAKERERLLERIQHPTMTQGQAAGVGTPATVSYEDEEAEATREYPETDFESPVPPVQPVSPIQLRGSTDGSEE